jgi:hypothetical protein
MVYNKMNFITRHLIEKINEQIKQKQSILKHDHFYYFDEPIKDKKKTIDRVNRWNPFHKEQILPTTWYALDGRALHELYCKLKNNQFYIYKKLDDGKRYKTRIKNK